MSEVDFLVSIVVPTHNRSKYSLHCIQSILDIASKKLQLIVHDTSDGDGGLQDLSAKITDPRFCYVHWSERLSMTENHERALALATGEYVCLIGDDDSVSAQIIEVAEFAKQRGIDVLTPTVKAVYSWPDFRTQFFGGAHAGRVYLDRFDGELYHHNSRSSLFLALGQACQGTDGLPKLYHGLVRRKLLDRIREKNGRVFFGASPDMSAAVALACATESFYSIDLPFTLPGASRGSNTGRSAVNKHKGNLESEAHISSSESNTWPVVLPRFFSVETIWANAAWETLIHVGQAALLRHFNLARLYALCWFGHRDYAPAIGLARRATVGATSDGGISAFAVSREYVICWARFVTTKFMRLMRPAPSNGRRVVAVVDDVRQARKALDEVLSEDVAFRILSER